MCGVRVCVIRGLWECGRDKGEDEEEMESNGEKVKYRYKKTYVLIKSQPMIWKLFRNKRHSYNHELYKYNSNLLSHV